MLRPKLILLLTEIFQNSLCLRNTMSCGTSHYKTEIIKNKIKFITSNKLIFKQKKKKIKATQK